MKKVIKALSQLTLVEVLIIVAIVLIICTSLHSGYEEYRSSNPAVSQPEVNFVPK